MRPKRCKACERQWFGSSNVCPNCGEPRQSRRDAQPLLLPAHPQLKNLLWVAAAVALLIALLKIN
jgi:predicted amidophosphoribosyltransferase